MKNVLCITAAFFLSGIFLAAGKIGGDRLSEAKRYSALIEELEGVLPDIDGISVTTPDPSMPESVKEVYVSGNGVAVRLSVTGYASGLEILCGVVDGRVTSARCVSSRETLGAERSYGDSFKGCGFESAESVPTLSGATRTTLAYKNAVLDALEVYDRLVSGKTN